ncbi:hypothetical protein DH2020_049120 [Rehmannia glutinosa]|uniref:Uncharacterized protein n=1 Tax=Rehmannia glutinosa TaxID=99300 RepID=A0ABR0U4F6_REHGL
MVKKENANFSIPDSWTGAGPRSEPEAPPGFRPQPPKTCTSAAAESSRNENPTSKEKGFRRVYRKRSTSSGQQSPRRTSRKRSRPQFYAPSPAQPPPATPRRRGRPPKARSMSQLSHQETETRKPNQVTSTPSERPQEQTSCLIRSFSQLIQESQSCHNLVGKKTNMKRMNRDVAVNKNQAREAQKSTFRTHDIDETLFDISLTEVSDPISGYRRVGNVSHNDQTSQGIDPKILQHVANDLQYMAGSQTAVDETKDSLLESDCMKTLVLLGICKVVQDLQRKHLKDLDISTLDSYYTAVRDAENMKVNVQWLHNRLDEIKDAVKFTAEAKVLVNEKNRRLEDIDSKKKELLLREGELERLKSEIRDVEEQVAREVVLVEELNKKIGAQTSRFSKFQHTQLMDGLI